MHTHDQDKIYFENYIYMHIYIYISAHEILRNKNILTDTKYDFASIIYLTIIMISMPVL